MTDNVQRQKDEILRGYDALKRSADMSSAQSTLTEISSQIAGLPDRIKAVRERGYAFAGYLEAKAETLEKQWKAIENDVRGAIERAAEQLSGPMSELDGRVASLSAAEGLAAATYIKHIEPTLEQMKTTAEAAQSTVQGAFGEVPNNVRQTARQLHTIEGYLELIDEATFELQMGEAIFMAVKAEWKAEHQDNP
jgi:predicted  nucleic acid-binding Zn-ribbon protein